jgi:hypothetical protein
MDKDMYWESMNEDQQKLYIIPENEEYHIIENMRSGMNIDHPIFKDMEDIHDCYPFYIWLLKTKDIITE